MEVYIDDNLIDELSDQNDVEILLEEIYNRLETKIIEEILLDGVPINKDFLMNNCNLDQISKLKFKTKQINELIEETLDTASDYLTKLKEGIGDTAQLFRQGDLKEGNLKYQSCVEGLEWYMNTLDNILSLLDNEKLTEDGEKLLKDLNELLIELMKAFENEDFVFVADILEYEVKNYVEEFTSFNQKLRNKFKKEGIEC